MVEGHFPKELEFQLGLPGRVGFGHLFGKCYELVCAKANFPPVLFLTSREL